MPAKLLRTSAVTIFVALLIQPPVLAYDTGLSDTAIREAYFLGQRHDEKTSKFFVPYTRHLPLPKKGPYVSEIRLLTPIAQVVQISDQRTSGYSAQQARLDYQSRGDSLLLVVHLELTPTYGQNSGTSNKGITVRQEDFWKSFRYGIRQKADWIVPRAIRGEGEYGGSDSYGNGGLIGAWVYVEYDANNVSSDDTEVKVFLPEDQDVETSFDLGSLR
jgi:hypothetical protein